MSTSENIKERYNRITGIYEMMDKMIKEMEGIYS